MVFDEAFLTSHSPEDMRLIVIKKIWEEKLTLRTLINKENTAESQNDRYILFIL